jgi:hypothetical protein
MAAMIVGATDQQAANASAAHFGEGDLLAGQGGGHAATEVLSGSLNNNPGRVREASKMIFMLQRDNFVRT